MPAHVPAHPHAHLAHTHARTHACPPARTRARPHACTPRTRARVPARPPACPHARTHTRMPACPHARTRTHAHLRHTWVERHEAVHHRITLCKLLPSRARLCAHVHVHACRACILKRNRLLAHTHTRNHTVMHGRTVRPHEHMGTCSTMSGAGPQSGSDSTPVLTIVNSFALRAWRGAVRRSTAWRASERAIGRRDLYDGQHWHHSCECADAHTGSRGRRRSAVARSCSH